MSQVEKGILDHAADIPLSMTLPSGGSAYLIVKPNVSPGHAATTPCRGDLRITSYLDGWVCQVSSIVTHELLVVCSSSEDLAEQG